MIEKNILFIHPLSGQLQELLKEVSDDEEFIVFEIDSLAEYGQVVGVLEQSVTFSSDLKKTKAYLEDFSQFVKNSSARNILLQDNVLPPHVFSKLRSLGLDENLKENIPVKSLKHKVGMFFNRFESGNEQTSLTGDKAASIGEKKEKDGFMVAKISEEFRDSSSNSMFNFDQNKRKAQKNYDFEGLSNFQLKKNKTDMSFLTSRYSNLQRKNVATFSPKLKEMDFKRNSFKPLTGELKRNPFKDSLGILPVRELERKELAKFEEVDSHRNKDRKKFEEVPKELKRKEIGKKSEDQEVKAKKKSSIAFEALLPKKNRKAMFQEEAALRPKRKPFNLEEFEGLVKRRPQFKEIEPERKRKKIYQVDSELNRKKGAKFEETKLKKKKLGKFDETELEGAPKKKLDLGEFSKEKAKGAQEIGEVEKAKKKGTFEETDRLAKKKGRFREVDSENELKRKKFEEVDRGKKKRTSLDLDEVDSARKKKSFKEVELELDKANRHFQEVINDVDRKKTNIKEIDLKKKGMIFEEEELNNLYGQIGSFEEVKRSKKEAQKQHEPTREEYDLLLKYAKDKKQGAETALDYRKLYKEFKKGKLKVNQELETKLTKKYCDDLAELKEVNVLPFESYGVEYLVNYNDLLWRAKGDGNILLKFAHFSLMKEFQGHVSFYRGKTPSFVLEYQGLHPEVYGEEYIEFEKLNKQRWEETELPVWKDETFQAELNEFIYPFYHEGEHQGFAVAYFPATVKNHQDAKKVELLLTMVKGVYLENTLL